MLSVFRKAGYAISGATSFGVTHLEFPILHSDVAEARAELQEAEAERASLRPVLEPRSIAVIGASRNPASVGGALFRHLIEWGFQGPVFPINREAKAIAGVFAYPDIASLPFPPELAFITVPAKDVADAARQCADAGVRAICVISAGFSEAGESGKQLQDELLKICRGSGMRMIGPNCLGMVNTNSGVRMLGIFAPTTPRAGNIAISSQSGALGVALINQAAELGLGVSSFVSTGNKADVSGNDLLQYWESDESTDVILLYLESFGNPRRFARISKRVSRQKPIVAVKSGRTAAGMRAASSHTAALASPDSAATGLFEQTGIIRVDTLAEFFSVARLLATQPIPAGRRVGILTNAGGPAILATDAASAAGLKIPQLSEETRKKLQEVLPPAASTSNPVDMIAGAGPEQYRRCLEILCDSAELDSIVVIFIPPLVTPSEEVAKVISEVLSERPAMQKSVIAVFLDPQSRLSLIPAGGRSVPVFDFPETAMNALGAAARYGVWRSEPSGSRSQKEIDRELIDSILDQAKPGWMTQSEASRLLSACGIRTAETGIADDAASCQKIAERIGRPVVLKVVDPPVLHKTEVEGVILNVDPSDAARAFGQLKDNVGRHGIKLKKAVVMPMAEAGVEVLAGITHEPVFGPLVAFGSGGVQAELLDDAAFRVLPLTDRDVREMIRGTRTWKLLKGYRGAPPSDVKALEELLLSLGRLGESVNRIAEIDLNPIIVHPEGLSVIDWRIRLF